MKKYSDGLSKMTTHKLILQFKNVYLIGNLDKNRFGEVVETNTLLEWVQEY